MCNNYAYRNFKTNKWQNEINVSDFIKQNYSEYTGDELFLKPPTNKTINLLNKFKKLNGKVLINSIGTTIGSHTGPGTVALFFWGDERTL